MSYHVLRLFSLLALLLEKKKKFVPKIKDYLDNYALHKEELRRKTYKGKYLVLLIFARRGRRDLRREIC